MNFMDYETTMQCVVNAFNGGNTFLNILKADKELKDKWLNLPDIRIDLLE